MKSSSSYVGYKETRESSRAFFATTLIIAVAIILATANENAFGQGDRSPNRQGVGARVGAALRGETNPANQANARRAQPQTPQPQPQTTAPQGNAPNAGAAPRRESCVLASGRKVGAADVVEISLEASGQILQTNSEGAQERAPMEVAAGFKYEERCEQFSPNGAIRTIRRYEQAGMKRKFGSSVARPLLDSSRKFVVSEFDGRKTRVYSLGGPLKDEQYALLNELPFNTTCLDKLLPNREVRVGDDWSAPDEVVAALLGVDAIENNTLRMALTSCDDSFAVVEIFQIGKKTAEGEQPSTMTCAAEGASIDLDLEGKFQFDVAAKRITWFGIKISERRSQSVAAPGLDWSATLKISVAPLEAPEKLTDDVVAPFKEKPTDELLKLYYNAQKGPWKFQHSRKWKLIEDGDKVAALCFLDAGEAVAQCNILSNGKIDLSTKPSLNGYKNEIRNGLGERFAEFKQDAEYEGPGNSSVYYVAADGLYEDAPYRWIYYLITDKDGNQATIMFELRADLLDKYDDSGNEIVESFRIVPRSTQGLREALQKDGQATENQGVPSASK